MKTEGSMSTANFNLHYRDQPADGEDTRQPNLRFLPTASGIRVAASVQALTPYEAVSSQAVVDAYPDQRNSFKLDWNESTIAPSPLVNEAIAHAVTSGRGLNWYPSLGSTELIDGLANYTGIGRDHFLITNGSDDALGLICATFIDQGDEVVVPVPTYNHFVVFAQSRGAEIRTIQGFDPFESDLDGIRAQLTSKTRLLYLVSPNNPTGVVYRPEEIEILCQEFPNTLIVLDEAYFEFAQITGIELVERYANLIVTRTFSKAFGLAGLRVGYLAAHRDLIAGLSRLYNPKSVNALGQIGAIAALKDLDYLNAYLKEVLQAKEILRAFFAECGVEAQITPANFVVVRVDDVAHTLATLESNGIYVRDRSGYPGLRGCLRMSVGTVEQTNRLIERLRTIF